MTNNYRVNRLIYLVGSEKNAGKTTYLNYLLRETRKKTQVAFLTIGIDGEKKDFIFDTPKPQIFTEPGDYFITSEKMLKSSNALVEICNVFPIKTVLGRIVLAKTVRGGFIELVGPENNLQLSEIIRYMKDEVGISTILVDGAANRVTHVATDIEGACIYILKVTAKTFSSSIDKLKSLAIIEKLSQYTENCHPCFFIKGALTENKLSSIPKESEKIVVDDFTKIFLSFQTLKKLTRDRQLLLHQTTKLLTIVVNLHDVERAGFEKIVKDLGMENRITYNPFVVAT